MRLPIYVAGGYPDKTTAEAVSDALEARYEVFTTFRWWAVSQGSRGDAIAAARGELGALRRSSQLVLLDARAGTGSSFEFGYFLGHHGRPGTQARVTWVTMAGDAPPVLDWFGGAVESDGAVASLHAYMPVVRVQTEEWTPAAIVSAIDGASARNRWKRKGNR